MSAKLLKDPAVRAIPVSILDPAALGNVYTDFLADRDVSGVRPATLDFYRREVGLFVRWTLDHGAVALVAVSADLLRAYFLDLRARRTKNGIHKNYTALRTFLKWAWSEYDQPAPCPIARVKVAGPEVRPQPALPLEAARRLLEAGHTGRHAARDRAIVLFLLDTGVRKAELCRLRLAALRPDGAVHLPADGTKTGQPRTVFLSRATQKALRAYLGRRGELTPDAPLFATQRGEPFTPSGLRQVIRRRFAAAGLAEMGLHAFRRAFALESLRAGADLLSVSRLLGHARLETTKRYLPQTEEDLRAIHARTSPVNRLNTWGK